MNQGGVDAEDVRKPLGWTSRCQSTRFIRALACFIGIALALNAPNVALADPIFFSGGDSGVGPGQAAAHTSAANQAYLASASGMGPVSTINFAGVPLGSTNSTGLAGVGLSMTGNDTSSYHWTDLSGTTHSINFGVTDAAHSVDPTNDGYSTTSSGKFLEFAPRIGVGSASFTLAFSTAISALGLNLTGLGDVSGETLHILFNDGVARDQIITGNAHGAGGIQFFGFTDIGADITSVTFELDGINGHTRDIFGADNIQFFAGGPLGQTVPGPSGFILLATAAPAAILRLLGKLRSPGRLG